MHTILQQSFFDRRDDDGQERKKEQEKEATAEENEEEVKSFVLISLPGCMNETKAKRYGIKLT